MSDVLKKYQEAITKLHKDNPDPEGKLGWYPIGASNVDDKVREILIPEIEEAHRIMDLILDDRDVDIEKAMEMCSEFRRKD